MGYVTGFERLAIFLVCVTAVSAFDGTDGPALGCSRGLSEGASTVTDLTVVAVGDILLARHVGKKIDLVQDPAVPFEKVKPWLSRADIAFGNLESPIVAGDTPIRQGIIFRCLTRYVPGLVEAGFDVLSTANNHAFDQGYESVEFTLDYLDSNGILAVGTRKRDDLRSFGRVIQKEGTALGFLAYSYAAYNDGGDKQDDQIATWHDWTTVKQEISQLAGKVDVLFVSVHAGGEYRRQPERRKVEFCRAVIDAGADAVIGHHPHWIQPVEIYEGKPIFYSLGNFVFDQGHTLETSQGLMVEFRIQNKKLRSTKMLPVSIERYCCPAVADERTSREILSKIGLDTDEMFFPEPSHAAGK